MRAEHDFPQGKKNPYSELRQRAIDSLEDLSDLKDIADYEARERRGETEYYTSAQMWHMLGLDAENHKE